MIEILSSGPFATVQDLGRAGYRAQGIGGSGAMDRLLLQAANLTVGNAPGAAGIENALAPLNCRIGAALRIAVAGAKAVLDGTPIPELASVAARPGQVLRIAPPMPGVWSYLAVEGGIDTPPVLGSRSTDLKIGIGGPLTPGTSLPTGTPGGAGAHVAVPPYRPVLRILPAREYDEFDGDLFWGAGWTVGGINRMGYLLTGPMLHTRRPLSLPSYPLVPGVVQVPPSGQPMVQMAEANTCGGYPKIGVVIAPDLRLLAQSRPGQILRMVRVTEAEATAALAEPRDWLAAPPDPIAALARAMRDTGAVTLRRRRHGEDLKIERKDIP